MSLRYLHALADGGLLALARECVRLNPDVAPLFPPTTLPFFLLFGTSRLVAHLTNTCYLFLLLVSVYLLGVHLYYRRAALLAVCCLATFNAVVNFSRNYPFEFPAAVVVTLGLYILSRPEDFRYRSWGRLFGALAGIALLTKTMTGVFFVGPVLYTAGALIRRGQLDRTHLTRGALAVGMGILVASIWWGPNFRGAFGYAIYTGFKEGSVPYRSGGSDLLALANLSFYALSLVRYGTSFFYALVFILVIAIRALMKILGRRARITATGNGGGEERVTALQRSAIVQARDMPIEDDLQILYRVLLRREPNARELEKYVGSSKQDTLTRQTLIDSLLNSSEFKNSKILVVPDHPMFNASTLRYYAELSRYSLTFFHIFDGPVSHDRLQEFRFALVKEGGFQGPEFSTRYNGQIVAALQDASSGFVPLPYRYGFPDGTDITIFVATSGGK